MRQIQYSLFFTDLISDAFIQFLTKLRSALAHAWGHKLGYYYFIQQGNIIHLSTKNQNYRICRTRLNDKVPGLYTVIFPLYWTCTIGWSKPSNIKRIHIFLSRIQHIDTNKNIYKKQKKWTGKTHSHSYTDPVKNKSERILTSDAYSHPRRKFGSGQEITNRVSLDWTFHRGSSFQNFRWYTNPLMYAYDVGFAGYSLYRLDDLSQ